ncbi:MAG TPA: GMC family oxidoreductase N-terminal domain-containing protein [Hyphomicrobiales bacterium]|nr:GMC family oxidoreductase N-terminal domain-containing protein [Hyphomicrobiales bacterium]
MAGPACDYVIVGAGSAGCTLAARLSEDADTRVLLVEAGGWSRDPWVKIPLGWGHLLRNRLHDWGYFTEPEPGLDGRRIECARGKAVGGSSAINAMGYVRGNAADYDRWASRGLPGWSYAEVLPYFRRQEDWAGGASVFRGAGGPMATRFAPYDDPLVAAYLAAADAAGHPRTGDYNGARQHGFGTSQTTIRRGRRHHAGDAYLRNALARPNLTLLTGALATRVVLEGGRAVGLEYERGGVRQVARAAREVILAGGVINSPQLLMLSGIGDPEELARHGIAVHTPLPGVGKNLQDHLSAGVEYRRRGRGPFHRAMRADRIAAALAAAYLFGAGFASRMPGGIMGFLKTAPGLAVPDVQVLFSAAPFRADWYFPGVRKDFADGFLSRAVLLRPESRGRIELASADPRAAVRIHQNFLAAERDRATIRAGVKLVREIGRQPALAAFVDAEISPGPGVVSDAALDAHIRKTAATAHHPLGTCRMGPDGDPTAVVGGDLRVRGVDGLRVVDAAVMPDLVGGNINAAVVMIAEKAADLVRGRAAPPPAVLS